MSGYFPEYFISSTRNPEGYLSNIVWRVYPLLGNGSVNTFPQYKRKRNMASIAKQGTRKYGVFRGVRAEDL
jgi:hypothetical protein